VPNTDSRIEIGRVLESDLDAIGRLHAHFWGEVSDAAAMAETLRRLEIDPDHRAAHGAHP